MKPGKVAATAAAFFALAAAGVFFALLIKVKGNLSYVYNFFVKTRGALQTAYFETALEGADAAAPYATDQTDPARWLLGTTISVNGTEVAEYNREAEIRFTEEYLDHFTSHEGIITYRGSYRRDVTSYGTPALAEGRFGATWRYKTGRFLKCDGVNYWSGNGWTGQPLAVRWDETTKQHMNLYDEAKQKAGLVEIIYPGMDGKIHFLNMETGEETRPAINVGMCFKGTCSLHPEYPLLICGSGDSATGLFGEQVSARIFLYNLIDGKKLYEFAADDPFAPRLWHGFDSSPVFCTAADTVICAGENGVLYTVHLNSSYDAASGTLTIDPDEIVRYRYDSKSAEERFETSELSNGSGSESSAVVWENYLFFGDNGGIFQCLDLNTMQPVWVQDLREDINSSPVLEVTERGETFLYVATTLKYYYDNHHLGTAVLYKLNAKTGEIVWQKAYEVHTVLGLAGGFLSSGASGAGKVSDYIYYAVSKVPEVDSSYLVAISRQTGEEVWRKEFSCDAWSSPALIYAADGSVKLCQCCGNGDILMMDAETGEVLDKVNFGSNIESTPVIFENHLVVGLRSEYIAGVELK